MARRMKRRVLGVATALSLASIGPQGGVRAQGPQPGDRNAPVNFTADEVQYDREGGIVTASGHVEAWQNDRTLRADQIVFNRNTGVAAATGNVVLQEADGQVVFSDYAELTQNMKDGILSGMRALLSQNGRLAATGARRTDAKINELSRAVYTTCDLCKKDPTRAPLWDIRARAAIQDVENKQIEYRDAVVDIYGIPVMYLPYLTHPDPSKKRASGLLAPSFGSGSKHLGAFVIAPYYVVIDDSSDVIVAPIITGRAGQGVELTYRQKLNEGAIKATGSLSDENDTFNGHIFARGEFALNEVWRYGFDLNQATSSTYIRDYRYSQNVPSLNSSLYIEGFGQGAYSRTDVRLFQSLTSASVTNKQPYVLPRTQYSYFGRPDSIGGRLQVEAGAFNVLRDQGVSDQRANLSLAYATTLRGPVGDMWKASVNVDSATYVAHGLSLIPVYKTVNAASETQAMPTLSIESRWPLARTTLGEDSWGTQLIEPIAKLMVGPRGSSYANGRIPNEDSLDVDFTDATLFERNRAGGVDRLEGGTRLAVGLHGAWTLPGGAVIDGLVGQSYRAQKDPYFTAASGLKGTVSDIVAHQTFTPGPYLDLSLRERFDRRSLQTKFADATASAGVDAFRVNGGYLYSTSTPYQYYDGAPNSAIAQAALVTPRNEVSLGASTKFGVWRASGTVRRDVRINKFVGIDAGMTYEDECFIFDVRYYRRYTSLLNDQGDSGLLFSLTFKTVGEFGFNAQ